MFQILVFVKKYIKWPSGWRFNVFKQIFVRVFIEIISKIISLDPLKNPQNKLTAFMVVYILASAYLTKSVYPLIV